MSSASRILFVQTWGLGDCIMALPALAGLKQKRPETQIHFLMGNAPALELLPLTGLFESCLRAPTRPLNAAFFRTLHQLAKKPFEEVFVATEIQALMGVSLRAWGVGRSIRGNSQGLLASLYNQPVQFHADEHRVLANLRIIRSVYPDVQIASPQLKLPGDPSSTERNKPYVVIQPGSGRLQAYKRPSLTCIESLMEALAQGFPELLINVLLGPEEEELLPFFEARKARWKNLEVLSGLSILKSAQLLKSALALIAGDSGTGHLAALVSCPVITLARAQAPDRTFPWGQGNWVFRGDWSSPHPNLSEVIKTFATIYQSRGSGR